MLVRATAALRSRLPRRATAFAMLRFFSDVTTTSRSALEDETMQQNKSTEIPSGWKGVKRFYEDVSVRPVGADGTEVLHSDAVGYRIVIRGRELRTNGMNELTIPTYGLALAIAGEFAAQGEMIHPPSLPLYNMTCMALDVFATDQMVPVPHDPLRQVTESEKLRDELWEFLETDTVCYRVKPDGRDPTEVLLRKRQEKYYQPLVKWFEEAASRLVLTTVKSTVMAMAFLHGQASVDETFEASRVEEEFQIEENGFVEDGHDTTRAYLKVNLTAVSTFLWLLPASRPVVKK